MLDLTIGIAVFNGENYIDRCIDSILKALGEVSKEKLKLNVLIVNDGSQDNSKSILDKYENMYDFIKIVNKENSGPASVRNRIIELCESEYLWFVDIDDEIRQDSLKFISEARLSEVNMFNFSLFSHDGKELDEYKLIKDSKSNRVVSILVPSPWHFIYSVELLKNSDIRFLQGVYYEDLNYLLKLLSLDVKINGINKSLYNYYLSNNSIMRKKTLKNKDDIFKVFDDVINYYKKRNIFDKYKDELEYAATYHLLYVAYVDVFRIDMRSVLLENYIIYLNKYFPKWRNNKYYKNESYKRKILYFLISNNYKNILSKVLSVMK